MKQRVSLFAIIAIISLISACGSKEAARKPAFSGIVTFMVGDVSLNANPVKVGDTVGVSDTIRTGDESIAVIQFSQDAVLTIKSNAVIAIDKLNREEGKDTAITIAQKTGSTFNKIVKKGTDYQVKTPTAVASVRGTSFEMVSSEKATKVNLLDGTVSMNPMKNGAVVESKTVELAKGLSVEVTTEKIAEPVKLTKEETSKLETFNEIALVPEVEKLPEKIAVTAKEEKAAKPGEKVKKAAAPSVVPETVFTKIIIIEKKESAELREEKKKAPQKPMTLQDIERAYGQLSRIEMNSGVVHIGAFNQKGNAMDIITLNGTVTVKTQDVKKISRHTL